MDSEIYTLDNFIKISILIILVGVTVNQTLLSLVYSGVVLLSGLSFVASCLRVLLLDKTALELYCLAEPSFSVRGSYP